ncbi:MAG: hypothetical protein WC763_03095 [Candidatus Paceibacterota bacterium]|jgi:hypothetical protein
MSLGLVILLIVIFGYASNWLNWRYLNHRIVRLSYYVGTFVHESSHALLCLATGARVVEFKVFSSEPHVVHGTPKLPLIGKPLISSAPIFGGLLFLFLVNHFLFKDAFALTDPLGLLAQIRPWEWQSWVMILLFLNVGAMLGPSIQDMKNVWPVLILLFFVSSPLLVGLGAVALNLIFVNIAIQLALIVLMKIISVVFYTSKSR